MKRRYAEITPGGAAQDGVSIVSLQIRSSPGNVTANLAHSATQIRRLLRKPGKKPDIVLLPELSSTGYSDEVLQNKEKYAEDPFAGPSFQFYSKLSLECGCCIAYGILCRRLKKVTISHVVVGPGRNRPVAKYDKIHLCSVGDCSEVAYGITPGELNQEVSATFQVKGVRVGLCICYDLRFPELWRLLAWTKHCDVILHPCAFSRDATWKTWHPFVTTRAVENGVYVVSANYAGSHFGDSIVCPPWVGSVASADGGTTRNSEILVCKGTMEGHNHVIIDQTLLRDVRKQAPFRDVQRFLKLRKRGK